MPAKKFAKRLATAGVALMMTALSVMPTARAEVSGMGTMAILPPTDLVRDRPTYLELVLAYSGRALGGAWDLFYDNVLDRILPPSPMSVANNVTKEDAMELFKLLSLAGYKLKEIDTQVGLIPTVAFKFGQVRDLSEADTDYLETRLQDWAVRSPGMGTSIQRSIMDTVIAINNSTDYHVSTLKVQFLPLPKVAFSVSPKTGALGEESSALMRAIQRVDKNVQGVRRELKK